MKSWDFFLNTSNGQKPKPIGTKSDVRLYFGVDRHEWGEFFPLVKLATTQSNHKKSFEKVDQTDGQAAKTCAYIVHFTTQ